MDWKPKPWLAALLSLLVTPLGMLYVQRPWWALGYFCLSIGLSVALIVAIASGFVDAPWARLGGSDWLRCAFVSNLVALCANSVSILVFALVRAYWHRSRTHTARFQRSKLYLGTQSHSLGIDVPDRT